MNAAETRLEYLAAHHNLDCAAVPRMNDQGIVLSLWGRIILFKSQGIAFTSLPTIAASDKTVFDNHQQGE